MALSFGGAGGAGYVDVGSAAALDNQNVGTIVLWAWFNSTAPASIGQLFEKSAGGGADRLRVQINASGVLEVRRDRATTDLLAQAAAANFTHLGANKWVCLVVRWDTGGANGNQSIWIGDLTNVPAAPSSYTSQTVGSGTPGDNSAGSLRFGNNSLANNGFDGRLAQAKLFSNLLTNNQVYQEWFTTTTSQETLLGNWIFWDPTHVVDVSGKLNTPTATSTTAEPHVPLASMFGGQEDEPYLASGSSTVTKTVSAAAVLQKNVAKTVGATAVLRKTLTKTVGATAVLSAGSSTVTKTVIAAAVIRKTGIAKTVSTSAQVGTPAATFGLDSFGTGATPYLLYWSKLLSGSLTRLERPVHYGNTGLGFTERQPSDDQYLFPPENTQRLSEVIQGMADRYGMDFRFNADGDVVLQTRFAPQYAGDFTASIPGGSPTVLTNPSALAGTYLQYTGAVSTLSKQVKAARIDLVLPVGASLGAWSVTVRRVSDSAVMAGPTIITPTATTDAWYYDGQTSVDGSNACVTTLYTGYYDTYTVELTSSGGTGGTVRRLDSLLLYHTDPVNPLYPQALSTDSNAVEVTVQSTMDDQRNYALVVGRRRAVVTDSDKLDTNPNNPVGEFVVQQAVDVGSITDPTAVNYVGRLLESRLYSSDISDAGFASYLSRTMIFRYRVPQPAATLRHTLLAVVQPRDPVLVLEGLTQTITGGAPRYVRGYTHRITPTSATTELTVTSLPDFPSYQPREDVDIDANFGGNPVANVSVGYTSLTGTAQTNLPKNVEWVSAESGANNDLVEVLGVPVTLANPNTPYLDMTGRDWPPIPGTVFVRPATRLNSLVTSATGTTLTDSTQSWATDQWKNSYVIIVAGTGLGQARQITTNNGTQLTVATWTTTPDATSRYDILPWHAGTTTTTSIPMQKVNPGETLVLDPSKPWQTEVTLEGLHGVLSVAVTTYSQNPNSWGGSTPAVKTETLLPQRPTTTTNPGSPFGYWEWDQANDQLNIIRTIADPVPGVNLTNPVVHQYSASVQWIQVKQGSGLEYVTNNPYHHFINVDYRDSSRRIYLPWKQGDTAGPYLGTVSSATTTSIDVSGTPWTSNQWVGYDVVITSGTFAGTRKTITSNDTNTINWSGALGGSPAASVTFSIEGPYDRNSQITYYDVRYRRLGPTSAGTFSDPYTAGSPFYDPYTSELGYLATIGFDALVTGNYRISIRSCYDDTIVAWLTEPTGDPTNPEAHWEYMTAGAGKSLAWDGVDQVGAWNQRQSEAYAAAAHGEFDLQERPIIGSGYFAWNREERTSGPFPPAALIAGLRDSRSIPVFGQGSYAQWYVHFEVQNDVLQRIAELANNAPASYTAKQREYPRTLRSDRLVDVTTSGAAIYHTSSIKTSGTASSVTTGSATTNATLTHTGAGWTVNAWKGHYVKMTSGAASGQFGYIVSNTATVLTINGAWSSLATGTYQIVAAEALVYTHLPEPTRVEMAISEWKGGASGGWSTGATTYGQPLHVTGSGQAYNAATSNVDDSNNWAQMAYSTSNTVNPVALLNNQTPVRVRFAVQPRPGTLWTGREGEAGVLMTRHVHLRVTINDILVTFEGINYGGTNVEDRKIWCRKITNDDHTLTFPDSDYRKGSSFKSLTTTANPAPGTEWVFVPGDFKKNFRGIDNEALKFMEYLQLEEVPKWDPAAPVAGPRARLLAAFLNYMFYLSVYTQDRSGRLVWCIDRSFLDKSKILRNQYSDWFDPASATYAAASSSTFREEWPRDWMTQHRRTVYVRQWLDEKESNGSLWQANQRTKFGFTASTLADHLLRHPWEEHDPNVTTLNGAAWSGLGGYTDDYSTWSQVQGKLPSNFTGAGAARQLGRYNAGTPQTVLTKWTWEGSPYWYPSVTRDFHPYYFCPPMVDHMQNGKTQDPGAPGIRGSYWYLDVDNNPYTDPGDPQPQVRNTGDDAGALNVWQSPIRDDSETYSASSSSYKRFWPARKVTPGTSPTKVSEIQANTLDYVRQDAQVHYEELRGIISRGQRPQEQPKKLAPSLPYFVNPMEYDMIRVTRAYKNPAYPRFTTGPQTTHGTAGVGNWFAMKFRHVYNWENGALFPTDAPGRAGAPRGREALWALNLNLMRVYPTTGNATTQAASHLTYDPGAWTGWKDDAYTGVSSGQPVMGDETHANYRLWSNKTNVFETGQMPLAVGPRLLTSRRMYFGLCLVNERRTVPISLA